MGSALPILCESSGAKATERGGAYLSHVALRPPFALEVGRGGRGSPPARGSEGACAPHSLYIRGEGGHERKVVSKGGEEGQGTYLTHRRVDIFVFKKPNQQSLNFEAGPEPMVRGKII